MAEFRDSRVENVVEYQIYVIPSSPAENTESYDTQAILCDLLSYSQSLIDDYIWQSDSFNLRACEGLATDGNVDMTVPFFVGSTNFGDNIEDEWFIVYLLLSISKNFPYVAVTVKDDDGEFLLIEAANYLPKWLEPETSENRVFLYQGKLHIIPLPSKPSEITILPAGKPSIDEALKILKQHSEKTTAFPWIQDAVMKKVLEYPSKAKASFHHVLCYLPKKLKYLLDKKPSLISSAVTAFVNRDPVDVNSYQNLKHFHFDSLFPQRVRFTKCLYGQLVRQDFIPDKSSVKVLPHKSDNTYKAHLLGLQLTYGFEMLYSQQSVDEEPLPTPRTAAGCLWEKYLKALDSHGYFKNEMEGSQLYCQLMENAKEYFSINCLDTQRRSGRFSEIKKLLQDLSSSNDDDHTATNEFPPDDDESWLEISPEELESLLSQYGHENHLNNSGEVDLNNVVHGMNAFVEKISSYEGAEFPSNYTDQPEIQFDPEEFMKSVDDFFEKPRRRSSDSTDEDGSEEENLSDIDSLANEQYNDYTSVMDNELSLTNVGNSFVKMEEKNIYQDEETENAAELPNKEADEGDEIKPVDIDLNLVQNFLESYSLQEGMPGPVSNILNSMGVQLPVSSSQSDRN